MFLVLEVFSYRLIIQRYTLITDLLRQQLEKFTRFALKGYLGLKLSIFAPCRFQMWTDAKRILNIDIVLFKHSLEFFL